MAKCIKIISTGKIIRVPDNAAAEAVDNGVAEYSNKGDWKDVGRAHAKTVTKAVLNGS